MKPYRNLLHALYSEYQECLMSGSDALFMRQVRAIEKALHKDGISQATIDAVKRMAAKRGLSLL
jgi:hypothetical protein